MTAKKAKKKATKLSQKVRRLQIKHSLLDLKIQRLEILETAYYQMSRM